VKRRSFYATCPGRDETNSARPDPLTLFNYKSPRVRFGLGLVYLCSPPFFQLPRSRVRTPRHGDWRRTPLPPPRRGRADAMRCDAMAREFSAASRPVSLQPHVPHFSRVRRPALPLPHGTPSSVPALLSHAHHRHHRATTNALRHRTCRAVRA
jgi:hypothetical protein